jgi:hypothetical protein
MNCARTNRAAGKDHVGWNCRRERVVWMGALLPLSLLAIFLLTSAGIAAGNEIAAGDDANPTGSRVSRVSPRLAAEIRAKLPDYEPAPPPPPSSSAPVDRMDDGEDRSDVVVLAPVTVTEKREARGGEWQLLTPAGRAALLKERYPGATPPGSSLSEAVHNYAKLMYTEDTRVERLAELDNMLEAARIGRTTESLKELKTEILRARMRPNDWRAESMDKSYNNGRR